MKYIYYDETKGMYYATWVVKHAGKQMAKFLKRGDTKSLIKSLESKGIKPLLVQKDCNPIDRGTWMCKELYLELVKWAIPMDYKEVCAQLDGTDTAYEYLRPEFAFGEDIVMNLFSAYEVIPQYPVFGGKYRIDWYVPELKIAIEFDEAQHNDIRNAESDITRQREIEAELGCRFIRYTA